MEVLITLHKKIQKDQNKKETSRAAGHSDNRRTERIYRKCFRCGYQYQLFAKFTKPPKDNEKRKKQVGFNERGNRACKNGDNNSDLNIYASMERMYFNDRCPNGNFGDSSQLTNWILDSVATCHMIAEVSDCIPGLLEDTDKHIEVAYRHPVTAKQEGQV